MRKVYLLLIAITFTVSGSFAQLTGTKNIPGDYADLVAAIADLNTQGVGAGGVVLNLVAGNPQTAPAGGYVIGDAGSVLLSTSSAANPVTITGNSNSITASGAQVAGTLTDAVFKLVGADYVTIQGFTMQENAGNTTTAAATNNMTEWGVALLYVTTTDGAQNNTIQNNTISLNRAYSNTFGIYSNTRHSATVIATAADVTTATGANSGNKVYNNNISNVDKGITFVGANTAVAMDNGNDIGGTVAGTGNTITNWGGLVSGAPSGYISIFASSYCILMNDQINDNVSYNTVTSATNITTLTTTGIAGIIKAQAFQPTGLTFTSNYNNNTVTLTNAATTAQMTGMGMQGLTTLATATYNCNNNNIINCANTGAGVLASTMIGMLHSSAPGTFNINGNTVRGFSTTTTTSGGFIGIQQQTNGVVNVLNINNNKIGDATAGAVTFSNTTTNANVTGIAVTSTGAASTCSVTMSGNDYRGIVYATAGTGAHLYISNTSAVAFCTINSNTFTNLNVNTTGTVTFIGHGYSIPTTGQLIIHNNSIVTGFNRGGAAGSVFLTSSNSASGTGSVNNYTNNNFSNITVAGTTTITGFNNTDGGTGSTKTITGNTFNNWTAITGAVNTMNFTYWNGASSLSNNTITNITGQSTITGITMGSTSNAAISVTVANNTITNLTSTGTGASVTGITCTNSSALINFNNNTISTLASTGAAAVSGISIGGATTTNVFKNKICDLSGSNASSTVNGILVSAGTTITVHNNMIADLRTPAANAANPLVGLNFTGGTTVNAFHNTVRIAGISSGALFGSSAVSVSTTPTINLRNNILVNLGTTNGAAFTSAYRRSTTTLTSYAAASNNNLFYAGTPGATNVIYFDGTNNDQTLSAYKLRVSARDGASVTENPPFLSTTCGTANFLKIDPTIATQVESGGSAIAGITDDIDGDIRNATTPDIGADEGIFTLSDISGPSIAYTALGNSACLTDNTLTPVTITDASSVNIAPGTRPRMYFKKSTDANTFNDNTNATAGWKYVEATGAGGSPFDFTTNYALLNSAPVVVSDIIQYFVVAQDLNGTTNISINSGSFNAVPSSVALTATAFPITGTINSYTLLTGVISTDKTIGAAGDYTSLTGTGGLFAAINAGGLGNNITVRILDATIAETGANVLNAINYGCAGSYTLTIKPNTGVTTTLTGSAAAGLITLNGADNVIIDGSNNGSTSRDMTIVNTNTGTSSAVVWLQSNGADGATGNTIKNCKITGNGNTQTLFGIGMGSSAISTSSLGTGNNTNTIQNNNISKTQYGIYSQGASIANKNTGNIITQNLMNTASPDHVAKGGIWLGFENSIQVTKNNIDGVTQTSSPDVFGIALGLTGLSTTSFTGNEVTNATVTGNFIGKVTNTGTFSAAGITVASATSGINLIANNAIYGVGANGTGGDFGAGIFLGGGTGSSTRVYHNTISMTGTFTSGSYPNFGLAIGGTDPVINVRNNVFYNTLVNGTGTSYAIGTASTTFANMVSNYNDFFTTTGAGFSIGKTGSLSQGSGTDQVLFSAWQTATAQEANSISANPLLTGVSNLQPLPGSPLINAGTPIPVVPTDITGFTRSATTPTIGAYEQAGDFSGPTITYTPLGNSLCLTDKTLTPVTITDVSGVNIAPGTRPRLYFKKSTDPNTFNDNTNATAGWKYVEATGAGGSPFDFTTNYALLNSAPVVVSDIIQYFVVAQDNATPNVGINSGSFATTPSSVALTATAFPITGTINNYTLLGGAISTDKTIGAAGDYTSLTGAGGLFAAINAGGLGNNITVRILDATITETGANVLNAINYSCTGPYTLTIKPNTGVTTTLSGSSAGGLITLNGTDNVIIDGSNNGSTSRDMTIVNTNAGTSSAVVWLQSNGADGATVNTVKNCNIAGNGNTQTLFGIGMGSSAISTTSLGTGNNTNTIQNNNISKTQYGIYSQGASVANKNTGNIITQNLMNTASPDHVAKGGIWLGFENNIQVTKNNIDGVTQTSSPDVFGIALGLTGLSTTSFTGNEVTNATVTDNFIGKVTNTGTFSAAGITVASATSGTTIIANNSIYGVGANGTSGDFGAGIFLGGGVGSTTNVYYNSISMTGTFTGGTYPNFGLAIGGVDPTVNVRNNVFYNTLVNGTGTSYAIGTASATFANLVSNYNDFFTTTGAGFSIGKTGSLSQGSGTDQTLLSAWQTATTQDANTISVDPIFSNLTNLQPSTGSLLVAAGTPIAGITTDITGFTRNATTPTIGAYEQAGDFSGPTIVYTNLGNGSCVNDRTLTPVTITDNSGVNIAPGTRPRLYFKKSTDANTFNDNTNATPGWKYVEATGAAGSPFSFTTNYSLLNSSPVVTGNIIQYFVVAQDNAAPNVSINSGTFTTNPTSVALTAAAFPITGTINSYNLAASISADVTIGSGGTYPTLTGTGGLFEAINSGGITADITARIISTPITEPGTVALNNISYGCGVGPNRLYIIPNTGIAAVLTGANPTGAIIKLNGADYVTIDGLNSGGSSLSITNTSPTTTSATIWIASANSSDGATNDSIRNCTIKGATNITTPVAILAGSGTTYGGAAEAANSNNSISGNVINTAQNAIFISGLATTFDQNWNVSNNNMGSTVAAEKMSFRGMLISNAQNFAINNNNIFGVVSTATSSATMTGIQVSGAVNGGTISNNKISDIKQVNTAGWGSNGIFLVATSTTSNVNVFNNMIHDVASVGFSDVTSVDNGYGIMVESGGGYNIQFNSINMTTSQTAAGSITAAINISVDITTAATLDIRNNIFANNQTVGTRYAILSSAANTVFSSINYNDYFSAGTLGFLGSAQGTLALWQTATAQDANSLNIAPVFVSATDLHLVPASNCGLKGKGTPIAGISFDIDNDPRSATTPDMGADEFAAPGGGVITWTGAVNTDWNNAGNWGCGGIPTITSEVVIPTGVPNYPVITLNVEIKKLTVNTGASVTVGTGFDLKLNGL